VEKLAADLWRIQRTDAPVTARQHEIPPHDMLVYLDPAEPNGFDRAWTPRAQDIAKHHAYALQWFAMAVVLLALYLRASFRSRDSDLGGA
jgi:surfeit locus 1 family protein